MHQIDKAVQHYGTMNMAASLIASQHGIELVSASAERMGVGIDVALASVAKQFAATAMSAIEGEAVFAVGEGALADLLRAYFDVATGEGRREADDAMREGELGDNAAALIQGNPGSWFDDGTGAFPGSGAASGPERLNDLIRAGCYLLAEIARVQRVIDAEDAMAASADERIRVAALKAGG